MISKSKYGKDAPFNDPVVRCDSCQRLLKRKQLHTLGMCDCGNRRVRNVLSMTEDEWNQIQSWGLDPEWLALFGAVQNG